jgi:hypothetical protein
MDVQNTEAEAAAMRILAEAKNYAQKQVRTNHTIATRQQSRYPHLRVGSEICVDRQQASPFHLFLATVVPHR